MTETEYHEPEPTTKLQERLEHYKLLGQSKTFLAREFLTFLWFQAETTNSSFEFKIDADTYKASYWVDDRILLSSLGDDAQESLMRGGDPSNSEEATAAIQGGKTVGELKIGLHIELIGDFTCILRSVDLFPRSIQLPSENTEEDEEIAQQLSVYRRLEHVNLFLAALDCCFDSFRSQRMSDAWETGIGRQMRSWMRDRQAMKSKTLH